MCGIAGVFDTGGPPAVETLEAMNDCLSHRGPDAAGTYVDAPVGFAHRRLAIIDPDAGAQPLFNEDGSVAVAFNGEIYNHRALRESLSGHTFRTDTDTEVLVHLYEEHGPSFVEHLEGMFAFALWDSDAERLLLARDPMGIKPLVYADDGDRIAFASEVSALFESGVELGGLDERAIREYLAFGFVPAQRTAFRNASKLDPGTVAVVTDDGIEKRRFYDPNIEPVSAGVDAAATELRKRVETAVERRLMSDVPLGAFLSGGIDSTIVVGTMAELMDDPVRTFTVGFGEERFDESWAAREVADYHNTDHHEYTITPDDVREAVPTVLDGMGEPFADPSLVPTHVVARETSREVTVALSGDGADELFAGYNRYHGEYYSKYYRRLPEPIRDGLLRPLSNSLPADRGSTFGEWVRKAQKFASVSEADVGPRHYQWVAERGVATNAPDEDTPDAIGGRRLAAEHDRFGDRLPADRNDALARMMAVDTWFGLPNQILRKVDRASMRNSLEVRVPFLDTDVVEYAMGLPTSHKITATDRKRVLKRAFDGLIPDPIQSRKKHGFDMPIGEWFKDELHDDFVEAVSTLPSDIVDPDSVLEAHDEHVRKKHDYDRLLWRVYVYATWRRRIDSREALV
jgi:asparagine synthase (glutamine-hydrolysing)